jgi:predicted site-specific integrase-resolvase
VRTAYKCRAYPDQEQTSVLNRTFGCIRVVWNQALAWRRQRYQADKTGTTYAQASAYLTAMKATEELTWLNEVSSLRATATGTGVRVFRDRASGLREGQLGLEKLLAATADGQVTVVRVTHEDRLARSGAGRLLAGSDRHPLGRAR